MRWFEIMKPKNIIRLTFAKFYVVRGVVSKKKEFKNDF